MAFQFASARIVNAAMSRKRVTCCGYINGHRADQRRKRVRLVKVPTAFDLQFNILWR